MKKYLLAFAGSASLVGAFLLACSSTTDNASSPTPVEAGAEAGGEAGAEEDVAVATDAPSDAPTDTATDVASESSSDGSAACNSVVQAATQATTSTVKGLAPAPTGGTIAAGKYFLTQLNIYDPKGPASAPSPSGLIVTLVIAGNVMDSVQDLPDGSTQTFSETFAVSGTTKLTRLLTCPKSKPDLAAVYSVTGPTGLVIYETDPVSKLVAANVYAKQ